MLAAPLALLWLLAAPPIASGVLWAKAREPMPGAPRVYGGYASGCLAGAAPLPLTGDGYEVMRPGRVRHFGHPTLVEFVKRLGAAVEAEQLGKLRVGDLSQPRGGPAPFGHASHQIGLDVDLAFALHPRAEGVFYEPMVDHKSKKPLKDFGEKQVRLLGMAAREPAVTRIFVNPVIKKALCDAPGDDRGWRRKVRPWFGHDEHFHVRLACPPDSPLCRNQAALPEGEGCDELAWWFGARHRTDQVQAKTKPKPSGRARSRGPMPDECVALAPEVPEEAKGKRRRVVAKRAAEPVVEPAAAVAEAPKVEAVVESAAAVASGAVVEAPVAPASVAGVAEVEIAPPPAPPEVAETVAPPEVATDEVRTGGGDELSAPR